MRRPEKRSIKNIARETETEKAQSERFRQETVIRLADRSCHTATGVATLARRGYVSLAIG